MNGKYFFLSLAVAGLLAALFFRAEGWLAKSNKENTETASVAESLQMTGWHDGEKAWHITAGKIVYHDGDIIFSDIEDGVLFRRDAADARFTAWQAEYRESSELLTFPDGLRIELDGKTQELAKGVWDGKKQTFAGKKAALRQGDRFKLEAGQMLYDEGKNVCLWTDGVQITATTTADVQIAITADRVSYDIRQKDWMARKNMTLNLQQADAVYKITAAEIFFKDALTDFSIPGGLVFTGEDFSGSAGSAGGAADRLLLWTVVMAGHNSRAAINAKQGIIEQGRVLLLQAAASFDSGTTFTADQLLIENNKYIAQGSVIINHPNRTTYCDELETEENSGIYKIKGKSRTVFKKD